MYKPFVCNPPSNHQHSQISSLVIPIFNVTGREYQMRNKGKYIYIDNNQLDHQLTCEDRRETELTGISYSIWSQLKLSIGTIWLIRKKTKKHTFTRSKFSDVTENRPLICTRLALDLSSKESLNPSRSWVNKIKTKCLRWLVEKY